MKKHIRSVHEGKKPFKGKPTSNISGKPKNSFKPPPLNIQNLKYVPKKGNQQQTSFRVPNYQYGQHSPTALC